jgi:hypothetical protein
MISEIEYNKSYKIKYKPVLEFKFERVNDLVDYTSYFLSIFPQIDDGIKLLNLIPNTRQAVLLVAQEEGVPTCLLSVQFQYVNGVMIVTANFRSQHATLGRPTDEELICYLATEVKRKFNQSIFMFDIHVNVANYHNFNEKEK